MLLTILLFVGVLLISGALSYAWWTNVRVVALQQDIYDLRDELFDAAIDVDGFSDPAYREARERLNRFAAYAGMLASGPVLFFLYAKSKEDGRRRAPLQSSDPRLQLAIDDIMRRSERRITRYVMRETAIGLFGSFFFAFAPSLRQLVTAEAERITAAAVQAADPSKIPISLSAPVRA